MRTPVHPRKTTRTKLHPTNFPDQNNFYCGVRFFAGVTNKLWIRCSGIADSSLILKIALPITNSGIFTRRPWRAWRTACSGSTNHLQYSICFSRTKMAHQNGAPEPCTRTAHPPRVHPYTDTDIDIHTHTHHTHIHTHTHTHIHNIHGNANPRLREA